MHAFDWFKPHKPRPFVPPQSGRHPFSHLREFCRGAQVALTRRSKGGALGSALCSVVSEDGSSYSRCLGPWRTLDAPESPRVGCNCGLVALEAARCRLDSKYLESTSHLIQCVSRSDSLSTEAAEAAELSASSAAQTQLSDIKNYFDIVQHTGEPHPEEPFQPIRPKRG